MRKNLVTELERRDALFKEGRESLVETVQSSSALKAPLYDLPTAVDVMTTRGYAKLPSILEKPHALMGMPVPRPALEEGAVATATSRIHEMIRLRLMWSKIPINFEVPEVANGKVLLRVENLFEASLTLLNGVNDSAPWTLISLKFLIAPDLSYGDNYVTAEYNRKVEAIASAAMASNEADPLSSLYSVALTFSQNIQLDILHSQVELEKGNSLNTETGANSTAVSLNFNQNNSQASQNNAQSNQVSSNALTPAQMALQQQQMNQHMFQQGKNKVLAQHIAYIPGVSLEISFSSGFVLRFSANGPTVPSSNTHSSQTSQTSEIGSSSHSRAAAKAKTKAARSRRTRGAGTGANPTSQITSSNPIVTTTTARGATMTLKDKRRDATKILVESLPPIVDPLTGEIAVYEVDPRSVDLEAIVSKAKRMYAHEKLQNLADTIQQHIAASQDLFETRVAAQGIEEILNYTDAQAERDSKVAGTSLAENEFDAPQEHSYLLASLSPDDVTVHINRGLLKSYIVLRLFENQAVYLQLNSNDGKPQLVTPCLDLTSTQISQLQRQIRLIDAQSIHNTTNANNSNSRFGSSQSHPAASNPSQTASSTSHIPTSSIYRSSGGIGTQHLNNLDLERSSSAAALSNVLQQLQRYAITYALKRIGAALPRPLTSNFSATSLPNGDFTRQFGPNHIVFFFNEATMGQSRLIVALDNLKIAKKLNFGDEASHGLSSSRSSLSSSTTLNNSSSSHYQLAQKLSLASGDSPNISAYTPLRIRFYLLANSTPSTYKFKSAVLLAVPTVRTEVEEEIVFQKNSSSALERAVNAASSKHVIDMDASNTKGRKRGALSEVEDGKEKTFLEQAENLKGGDGDVSSNAPEAKRAKLIDTSAKDGEGEGFEGEKHKMREISESRGRVGVSGVDKSSAMDVDKKKSEKKRFESIGSVAERAENVLSKRETSMAWFGIMSEVERTSGVLVTRVLILEDLDRTHSQYKPLPDTFNKFGQSNKNLGEIDTQSKKNKGENNTQNNKFNENNGTKRWSRSYVLHKYSASPLHLQHMVLTIDDAKWSVTLTESQSLLPSPSNKVLKHDEKNKNQQTSHTSRQGMPNQGNSSWHTAAGANNFEKKDIVIPISVSAGGGVRSTRYNASTKEWCFTYPRATPLSNFFVDLRGLAFLHKIFLQFLALSRTHCPSGTNLNEYLITPANTPLCTPPTTWSSAASGAAQFKTPGPVSVGPHAAPIPSSTSSHGTFNSSGTLINPQLTGVTAAATQNSNSSLDLNYFRLIAFTPTHISFAYGEGVHNANLTPNNTHQRQKCDSNHEASSNGAASHPKSQDTTHIKNVFHIYWRGGSRLGTQSSGANNIFGGASSGAYALDSPPHVVFEPEEHPLGLFVNAHVESWLNEPSLRFLLELIWNSQPTLSALRKFVSSHRGTLRTIDLLVIPQATTKLRVFFRQWSLDWRFLGNRFVCVEEVHRIGTEEQHTTLLNFVQFMQSALKRLMGTNDFPENSSQTALISTAAGGMTSTQMELTHSVEQILPNSSSTTTPGSANENQFSVSGAEGGQSQANQDKKMEGDSPTNEMLERVAEVLAKQRGANQIFFGKGFVVFHSELTEALMPHLYAYFGSLRLFLMIEKEDTRAKRQINENGEFVLPYRPNSECEISLILRKPLYTLDIIFPSTIGQDEVELLALLLKTKVIAPPYRSAHLRAFLAIFMLPQNLLSGFTELLRYARDRTGVTLNLNFSPFDAQPPPISVMKDSQSGEWTITLSLIFTNPDNNNTSITFTVSYSYKTRLLSSPDSYGMDFLVRNSLVQKGFGSLAGAVDSIMRTLIRSWNAEHSRFLLKNPHLIPSLSSHSQSNSAHTQTSINSSTPNANQGTSSSSSSSSIAQTNSNIASSTPGVNLSSPNVAASGSLARSISPANASNSQNAQKS